MQYREFGNTGKKVSALGFGAMRLPTFGADDKVDEAASIEMFQRAIDAGVNYFDTAWPYHGGNSERVLGKALKNGYREKVLVATKMPVWNVKTADDFDLFLDEQLERLEFDRIDFYLLHCLNKKHWPHVRDLGVLDWAEDARADGRIDKFGFSFHDNYDVFCEIVDAHDWDFCQIQYNFVHEETQAGTKGLQYAADKGLGVVVMEPLFGGTLADPPEPVRDIWTAADPSLRPADVALRWLWDKPEVSTVLSGMSTLEQVDQNLASAARSGVGTLPPAERELVARVRDKYIELSPIPCSKCGYCLPCPEGVNIPLNFELFNNADVFSGKSAGLCRNLYRAMAETEQSTACVQCGTCEEKCPQQIEIPQRLEQVAARFQPPETK